MSVDQATARRKAIESKWCNSDRRIQAQECARRWSSADRAVAAQERALRLQLRDVEEKFGHKQGTAPTHASAQQRREGALARLYMSGAIDLAELGAAEEIAAAAARIGAAVGVRTMSVETRVDNGGYGNGAFWEGLGQVRREMAYRAWREALGDIAPAIEDLIIQDIGLVETASTRRIGVRRLRKLLVDALASWNSWLRWARDEVDDEKLVKRHAALA